MIDGKTILKDSDGKPIPQTDGRGNPLPDAPPVTVRFACVSALFQWQGEPGFGKHDAYHLALTIQQSNEFSLAAEQIAKVKKALEKSNWLPLVVGQCIDIIDPGEAAKLKKEPSNG